VLSLACAAAVLAGCRGTPATDTDVLRWGVDWTAGYTVLDPLDVRLRATTSPAENWLGLIYGTMIRQTGDGLHPGQARSWSTPDSSTIVLDLFPGLKFQDGTSFDASAVKNAWDRVIALPEGRKNTDIAALGSVDVLGPSRVRINLKTPIAWTYINRYLTEAGLLSVPSPRALREARCEPGKVCADYARHVTGAGPYRLASLRPMERVSLVLEPTAWRADEYHFPRIDFIQTATGSATTIALESGRIDGAFIANATGVQPFLDNPDYEVITQRGMMSITLGMCTTKGPTADVRVRRAIAMAIDERGMNKALYEGRAGEGRFHYVPGVRYNAKAAESIAYDPEEAARLIRVAGARSETLTILVAQRYDQANTVATIVQAELGRIGLNAELRPTNNVNSDVSSVDPDLVIDTTNVYITAANLPSAMHWCSRPDWSGLRGLTDAALNVNATHADWDRFQAKLFTVVPRTFFLQLPNTAVVSRRLTGVSFIQPAGLSQVVDLAGVRFAKGSD
jgi:peptide/nickel transport system substrate-binding protein